MFKGASRIWIMQEPFGENVKLPDNVQTPSDATVHWIGHFHRDVCGIH